ncbi:uncharacterized protein Dana_GF27120 [Drosophila ananassae]|uniref:Uncharacterized protein n=1 Tax=Drosophila ananassae TaxID=7217 RepID=A0A0P9A8M4_DROAN|nr:uncharacterized protein Dana_GF27120 [Drosophila ananassae]
MAINKICNVLLNLLNIETVQDSHDFLARNSTPHNTLVVPPQYQDSIWSRAGAEPMGRVAQHCKTLRSRLRS